MGMRHSQTAVVERGEDFAGTFATEPYEAPWAGEARWFVQVIEKDSGAEVELVNQISPDGITWCDAEHPPIPIEEPMTSWGLKEFGAWLRVRGVVRGGTARLRFYLVCKE